MEDGGRLRITYKDEPDKPFTIPTTLSILPRPLPAPLIRVATQVRVSTPEERIEARKNGKESVKGEALQSHKVARKLYSRQKQKQKIEETCRDKLRREDRKKQKEEREKKGVSTSVDYEPNEKSEWLFRWFTMESMLTYHHVQIRIMSLPMSIHSSSRIRD